MTPVDTRSRGILAATQAALAETLIDESGRSCCVGRDGFQLVFSPPTHGSSCGWHKEYVSAAANKSTPTRWVAQLLVSKMYFSRLRPIFDEVLVNYFLKFSSIGDDRSRNLAQDLHLSFNPGRCARSVAHAVDRAIIPSILSGAFMYSSKTLTAVMVVFRHCSGTPRREDIMMHNK